MTPFTTFFAMSNLRYLHTTNGAALVSSSKIRGFHVGWQNLHSPPHRNRMHFLCGNAVKNVKAWPTISNFGRARVQSKGVSANASKPRNAMHLNPKDFEREGRKLLGRRMQRGNRSEEEHFRANFGCSSHICALLWMILVPYEMMA